MSTIKPEKLSFMNLADSDVLIEVAAGTVDLNALAREILASRGLDQASGRWIGFEAARQQLNQPCGA